jgi:hypothetical protein
MAGNERAATYRQRALEMEAKARAASTPAWRRAWLIVARDYHRMAYQAEGSPNLAPSLDELQKNLSIEQFKRAVMNVKTQNRA